MKSVLNSFLASAAEEANLVEGMRAAAASAVMLLAGSILHIPEFAWAAIGAFWTCLAAATDSPRSRFASMFSFALISALCGGLTSIASGHGIFTAAIALFVFVTVAGLARIWGPKAHQVAILVATACVVMVDKPSSGGFTSLKFLGLYLFGALFTTAFNVVLSITHPFSVARHAVRLTYRRLAKLASFEADRLNRGDFDRLKALEIDHQVDIATTNAATTILAYGNGEKPDEQRALWLELEELKQARNSIQQLSKHAKQQPIRAVRRLRALATLLREAGAELTPSSAAANNRTRFQRFARRLHQSMEPARESSLTTVVATRELTSWPNAAVETVTSATRELRDQVNLSSGALHFALRLGIATTLTYLTIHTLHLPLGYWATMAVLLILQPSASGTLPRSFQRAAGTTIGTIFALAIGALAQTPLAISLAIFPLIGLTITLRSVGYSTYVAFLTPAFVLVADYAMPYTSSHYAFERLADNVLGSIIAVAATYVLWPSQKSEPQSGTS